MKKEKTKSVSKLKPEKKLNTKSSANNIKKPNNKKFFPESSSNKKSRDFLQQKIKHNIFKNEKKNKETKRYSYSKEREKEKEKIKLPIKKRIKCFNENQLLLNINNVNNTNNNNIYNINNTNNNTNINSKKELITNRNNTYNNSYNNDNPNQINMDEKILLKIHRLKLKYEKKLKNDTLEIKSLTEKNDKLEELVLKLKNTLDKANEIFPDFLEQIISTKTERERESNKSNDFDYLKNDNIKLKNELITIIHGLGSGALRLQTKETLSKNKNVLEYKTYYYNQGCTIVKIKI